MSSQFRARRRIEFYETDMAGIVHFSNYFRFMESTEHDFFRSLGLSLHAEREGRMRGWARVEARCEYVAPLHYMDEVDIHLAVSAKTQSSLSYDFVFRRVGADGEPGPDGGAVVARGFLTVVYVERASGAALRATRMPEDVARAIQTAGARAH
jgi:YbgC/YbaW family acyl-CoA thioester hydrolase